ncbi:MAG: M6 family metalloprotease domain-containing protein [bacterium]|nr:M6 family metalloprotease domain-containing protein [bacterium]
MMRKIIEKFSLLFLILVFTGPALALPPPDPRFPEAGIGFELNYLKSHAAAIGLKGFFPEAVIQPQGSYNLLVIMMNFSDAAFSSGAQAYFQDLFFGNGDSGAYDGRSFVLYYEDMAAGVFRFNRPGEANGHSELFSCYPETATQTHNYYGTGGDTMARRGPDFAKEAVNCAHNHGINLSNFDNNGDGVAESIIIIHPGFGAEQTGENTLDIWSHSVDLPNFSLDGVGVKYALGPEKDQGLKGFSGIGIYAHEYTHNWGIPDLYDPNTTQSRGLGFYDLMSYGLYLNPPVYLSAWPRHKLGWLKEKPADVNLCPAELAPVESSGEGYVLYPNGTAGNEYFLVTFNTREGNDELLPARGVLIWHVDEAKWGGESSGTPNNESCYPPGSADCCSSHFLVALEQADDAYNLEIPGTYYVDSAAHPCPITTGYFCDAQDYWSAGAYFTESTTPGSKTYCGGGSAISLDNIKVDPSDSERMLFALVVDPDLNPIYPPVITSIPVQETEIDELYQYQLGTEGTLPVEYSLVNYPTGVTLNAESGLLTWVPNDTQIGGNHLTVTAENCWGKYNQTWELIVTYTLPEEEKGKSQGCGCNSLEGMGVLPLLMIGFPWLRRSRRGGGPF